MNNYSYCDANCLQEKVGIFFDILQRIKYQIFGQMLCRNCHNPNVRKNKLKSVMNMI